MRLRKLILFQLGKSNLMTFEHYWTMVTAGNWQATYAEARLHLDKEIAPKLRQFWTLSRMDHEHRSCSCKSRIITGVFQSIPNGL